MILQGAHGMEWFSGVSLHSLNVAGVLRVESAGFQLKN